MLCAWKKKNYIRWYIRRQVGFEPNISRTHRIKIPKHKTQERQKPGTYKLGTIEETQDTQHKGGHNKEASKLRV